MEVLCVGNPLLPSEKFREAIVKQLGGDPDSIREVPWATDGSIGEEQHHLQVSIEQNGTESVPEPTEIIDAVGDAEAIAVHFAPISEAVLEAGDKL